MLEQALEYTRRGWSVIPVPSGQKAATIKWGKYRNTKPDEARIRQWFSKEMNAAVLLGEISGGLTCLDFDEMQGYERWKQANPDWAATLPTVQTSRGMHVYFRSTLTKTQKREKLDIKASGYTILPPSLHPDQKTTYTWTVQPNGEIPELTLSDLGIKNFTEEAEEAEDTQDTQDLASLSLLSSPSSTSSLSSVKSTRTDSVNWDELDSPVQHYVNKAIKCTLPSKTGYRNFLVFQYCRWLKGHPEFEGDTAGHLKTLVLMWHERALPFIGTKAFDETWADFAYGWKRVKFPKGNGALKTATDKALDAQTPIPAEAMYEKPEMKLLVRICYELQILQQNEPFWLSWNDAAWILGVTTPTAGKWLCMLEADEIIQEIEKHTHRKATRYKFLQVAKGQ